MQQNKLTNEDLEAIAGLLDKQTAVLATKEEIRDMATKHDLADLEAGLKAYMQEGFEAVMVGMDAMSEAPELRDRVDKLEHDVAKLKATH